MKAKHIAWSVGASLVIALAACGGGSSTAVVDATVGPLSAANPGAVSTGSISAFGSVFVNGHEFSTANARVFDDDSGAASSSTSGLEVGMVVDVVAAAGSSASAPAASELHVHPLARGYVDASNTTPGILTVMGQTVQLTAATNYSDHRACVSATTSPCAAITGQSGLIGTTGSGAGAVAGSYVTVHGYLFTSGASTTNIVATLVSVRDAPGGSATGVNFKAEGVVTATDASSITIGGLKVDLSHANCYAAGATVSCATAFSAGQVVSAFAAAAPSLPATDLVADVARLRSKVVADTAGATVEVEGAVSSVTASPASFVVRGISVDASGLPTGSSLPAVGDIVRVLGTLANTGQSVTATSVTVVHAAHSVTFGFEGDASGVAVGSAENTYTFAILGQNVTVTATTRLADRSVKSWDHTDPASNPFNIATFQTYLAASGVSPHLLVRAAADASGKLTALSVTIVPASSVAAIAGVVDASPAPVNSSTTGTPSTFLVHGIAISADPASVLKARPGGGMASVAAGDDVAAIGTFTADTLVVAATPSRTNVVIDFGVPSRPDHDGF